MEKHAIVTGASRGLGRAIALGLAKAGYDIAINYQKNADAAEETAACIREMGVRALTFQADVSDFAAAGALVDAAKQEFGSIEVLVNNAGITRDGLIARMKEQDFDDVLSVNLKSAFCLCRHVIPLMMRARYGRIINIASIAGVIGNAGQANYSASKAGLIGMTKAMAREVARRGITVNAIAPGFIETDMTKAMRPEIIESALAAVPMGKMGTPEDVASMAVYLAEQGGYITGQTLVIDGGMAM